MQTVTDTVNALLGTAPSGYEWLAYTISGFIVIVLFSCLMSILRAIFDFVSGKRR